MEQQSNTELIRSVMSQGWHHITGFHNVSCRTITNRHRHRLNGHSYFLPGEHRPKGESLWRCLDRSAVAPGPHPRQYRLIYSYFTVKQDNNQLRALDLNDS